MRGVAPTTEQAEKTVRDETSWSYDQILRAFECYAKEFRLYCVHYRLWKYINRKVML